MSRLKLLLISLLPFMARADCVPFEQARRHIGETVCISGRVVRVESGTKGVHYLDFCDDYRLCPFSVVVFPYDMKNVGDVRELAGKVIEIRGEVKEYDDRAEIILESRKQLNGPTASLPPLSKSFDVEQRGHFSAGQSRAPHRRNTSRKRQKPTLPVELPNDVED